MTTNFPRQRLVSSLHQHPLFASLWCLLLLLGWLPSAFAGDSIYGKVIEVKSAELVVLDYGKGQYQVRIAGVLAPREGQLVRSSKDFVSKLVLGQNVRLRFDGFNKKGEMVGQLQTDDPQKGIQDVGLELVRSGLVRRQPNYDYKYQKLSMAEKEAQRAKRGTWATTPAQ